jgi:hypothetical protein
VPWDIRLLLRAKGNGETLPMVEFDFSLTFQQLNDFAGRLKDSGNVAWLHKAA